MTDQPDGLSAAEQALTALDEDVTRLWKTSAPKGKQIAEFLFTPPGGQSSRIIAMAMPSGRYQFYAPCNIAPPVESENDA